ncbi:MAG: GAF domain-containing protein [Synechococcus sp.]|nr:GAF domain-containing protein [Synechococcus sp.]
MIAPPTPPNEEYRLAALYSACLLDTPPEAAFDLITRLTARICRTKIALLTLVDRDRQWFKSRHGLLIEETPRLFSFCAHAIQGRDLLEVTDATQDERFWDNPLVQKGPKIRFYAGMPVHTTGGYCLGTLCVIDDTPRHLSEQQRTHLQSFARQIERHIQWQSHFLS